MCLVYLFRTMAQSIWRHLLMASQQFLVKRQAGIGSSQILSSITSREWRGRCMSLTTSQMINIAWVFKNLIAQLDGPMLTAMETLMLLLLVHNLAFVKVKIINNLWNNDKIIWTWNKFKFLRWMLKLFISRKFLHLSKNVKTIPTFVKTSLDGFCLQNKLTRFEKYLNLHLLVLEICKS